MPNEYLEDIKANLSALKLMREKEGVWWDSENPPEKVRSRDFAHNYMLNVEALRCFFDYSIFLEDIEDLMPIDEIIIEDLNKIIECFNEYGFPATPYLKLEEGQEIEKGKTDFSDSLCSTLDLLIMVKSYMENRGKKYNIKIPKDLGVRDLHELIVKLFKLIDEYYTTIQYLDKYYEFIAAIPRVTQVSLYFTHQYLITVNSLFNYFKEIKGENDWEKIISESKTSLEELRVFLDSLRIKYDGYDVWVREHSILEREYNVEKQFIFTVYAIESLMYLYELGVKVDFECAEQSL